MGYTIVLWMLDESLSSEVDLAHWLEADVIIVGESHYSPCDVCCPRDVLSGFDASLVYAYLSSMLV